MSNTPDQRIDEVLKDCAESAWSLGLQNASLDKLYTDTNNRMTPEKAKAALESLFETMMAEVAGESYKKDSSSNMLTMYPYKRKQPNGSVHHVKKEYAQGVNQNLREQRQRIPQVISKYFNTEEK